MIKLSQNSLGLRLYPLSSDPSMSHASVKRSVLLLGLLEDQDLIPGNVCFSFTL